MTKSERAVLFEAAGFLNMLVQGLIAPNITEQAAELLDKIGAVLADAATTEESVEWPQEPRT